MGFVKKTTNENTSPYHSQGYALQMATQLCYVHQKRINSSLVHG